MQRAVPCESFTSFEWQPRAPQLWWARSRLLWMIGDARSYLTALLVVNTEPLKQEFARCGITGEVSELLGDPRIVSMYEERVAARLKNVSQQEQVRRFTLLAQPFTLESGELTPTLKLRRGIIVARHVQAIEAMYARQVGD